MPLTIVISGRRVRLRSVNAGEECRGRLAAMGLVPGVEFEVLSNVFKGPVILMVGESRIMLGREMAQKIVVA
jgi:Fe2+ transport system protein FeoA